MSVVVYSSDDLISGFQLRYNI